MYIKYMNKNICTQKNQIVILLYLLCLKKKRQLIGYTQQCIGCLIMFIHVC